MTFYSTQKQHFFTQYIIEGILTPSKHQKYYHPVKHSNKEVATPKNSHPISKTWIWSRIHG
ncbi:MAG: hypothetical protein SWX82_17940 [Cyanobacteriota bacterium]|nr:hypothetical protein [Cyanobacteriota bacterium]